MNYIELINNFWKFYDENKTKINTSDIVLYKVLLRYCNKINWINPFSVNPFLMNEICPLAKNTYYKSLQNLHTLKVIIWNKGKNNISNQIITILKFENSTNNSIENSIKFCTENSIVNNNKTIIQLNEETIKNISTLDFDLILESQNFKKYLKDKKLIIKKNNDKLKNKLDLSDAKIFYDNEILINKNDSELFKSYVYFVDYLFGKNDTNSVLENCLSIPKQVSFKNFGNLMAKRTETRKIMPQLLKIENNPKYYENRNSLHLTILTFLTTEFKNEK